MYIQSFSLKQTVEDGDCWSSRSSTSYQYRINTNAEYISPTESLQKNNITHTWWKDSQHGRLHNGIEEIPNVIQPNINDEFLLTCTEI